MKLGIAVTFTIRARDLIILYSWRCVNIDFSAGIVSLTNKP